MARRRRAIPRPGAADVDAALDALNADQLRDLVREVLPWLDDRAHASVVHDVIDRAARAGSGWSPAGPTSESVTAIVAFAESAKRAGVAEATEVDGYLREACKAMLDRNYGAAVAIFRALLVPISVGDIDLGQEELVDDVLGVDMTECAARYAVSVYMTTAPQQRACAVRAAIEEMGDAGRLWSPLREIERVALEPLPGFEDFLPRWRGVIEQAASVARPSRWDSGEDRWLREVVRRLEGADGLGVIAHSTRRAADLRAWCDALIESADWKAALSAYTESAEVVIDKACDRGEFLDGAALAAQELGRKDLPARLERAWRGAPSMLRLRRWLGSAKRRAVVLERAAEALEACPKKAHRQRAFLHLVLGDHASAAKLLARAPGLGWSDCEHPGHMLFPLFHELLGGDPADVSSGAGFFSVRGMDITELKWMTADRDGPRLSTPEIDEILQVAVVDRQLSAISRKAVCAAMRKAAEKRVAGVTENKRRRYYGHAASLVAACAAIDATPDGARWLVRIRAGYSRYPALRRELDARLGA